jgi:hypothetical protein
MSRAKAAEKVSAQIRMAQGLARAEMDEQMLSAMIAKVSTGEVDAADPKQRAAISPSNAAQVKKVRGRLEGLGLDIASPDEAREILALKGGDQVGF